MILVLDFHPQSFIHGFLSTAVLAVTVWPFSSEPWHFCFCFCLIVNHTNYTNCSDLPLVCFSALRDRVGFAEEAFHCFTAMRTCIALLRATHLQGFWVTLTVSSSRLVYVYSSCMQPICKDSESDCEFIWLWVYHDWCLALLRATHLQGFWIRLWVYLAVNLSDCEFIWLWVYLTVSLSDCEFIWLWVYLTASLCGCEFIWLWVYHNWCLSLLRTTHLQGF